MPRKIVVIPAKSVSRRVPDKNWRPFSLGQSLVERKIKVALGTQADLVIVSTDRVDVPGTFHNERVEVRPRDGHLCGDRVDLRRLFMQVLSGFEEDVVFWAHPTSPFVCAETIDSAMEQCLFNPGCCVLGVKERREFYWTESGPVNYDPIHQPRSQDLQPVYAVTGGVHCAFGRDFIGFGAVAFLPVKLVCLHFPEALDIDDLDDWHLAQLVAGTNAMVNRER